MIVNEVRKKLYKAQLALERATVELAELEEEIEKWNVIYLNLIHT